VPERLAEERRADLRAAERESKVAGGAGMDGIHGEAAGFIGGTGECGEIGIHKRRK
jgi:hypothetical protein